MEFDSMYLKIAYEIIIGELREINRIIFKLKYCKYYFIDFVLSVF